MSFLDSRTRAASQGIGKPVPRREDERLITGAGCYSDDVNAPGQAYAAFVRSPHAHAAIRAIDATAARAAPGVLAVLSGREAASDAALPGAPSVWDEHPSNVCVESEVGDAAAVEAAFTRAAHVVRLETQVNRVTGGPLEPRAALGVWDEAAGV